VSRSKRSWATAWLALFSLVVAIGAGCGGSEPAAVDDAPDIDETNEPVGAEGEDVPVTIDLSGARLRVGTVAATSGYRLLVHEASGVYDDAAYDIVWTEFESSRAAVEALNAGAIDIALSQQATVAVLAMGNADVPWTEVTRPFVMVAAETDVMPTGFNLLVPVDSDAESIADLAGQRIAFSPGSLGHYFFVVLLRSAGLELTDVDGIQLPAGEGRAAYLGGSVDALIAGYNGSLPLVERGDARVLATATDFYTSYEVTLVRPGLLDDAVLEAALRDLLVRVEAVHQWSLENLGEVAAMMELAGGLTPEEARISAETTPKRRVPVGAEVIAALQDQADVFHEEGINRHAVELSVLVDARFDLVEPVG
jgi:sulfonate transport system substrate-binding protein